MLSLYIFSEEEKKLIHKQMAYILGRLQIFLEIDDDTEDADDLTEIISNAHLNNSFLALAREVHIYKLYLYVLFVCFVFLHIFIVFLVVVVTPIVKKFNVFKTSFKK